MERHQSLQHTCVSTSQWHPSQQTCENSGSERQNSKKCAGTQTSFSSLPDVACRRTCQRHQIADEGLPQTSCEPESSIESHPQSVGYSSKHTCGTAQSHQGDQALISHHLSQPSNTGTETMDTDLDMDVGPLNLTTSGSQQRPSVITCAPSSAISVRSMYDRISPTSSEDFATPEEICDPAIEEHFRRSLEKKYPGYNGRAKSTSPSSLRRENSSSSVPMCGQSISHRLYEDMHMITDKPCGMSMSTPEPKLSVVINSSQGESVTGSVDDHFAKSLGATWNQIKANDAAVDVELLSVDDHFAKALGEAWYKIKETEDGSSHSQSPSCSSPPQSTPAVVSI